jgi:hypothetical protein
MLKYFRVVGLMFGAASSAIVSFIIVCAYFDKDHIIQIYTNHFNEALLECIIVPIFFAITLYSSFYYLCKERNQNE